MHIIDSEREGPPVEVVNAEGRSDVVLVCEHASNRIPRSLENLGLTPPALESHIAWDPGAARVARQMASILDAPLVLQRFSRLVYDCNRAPLEESAIIRSSDSWEVPGNENLGADEFAARVREIYIPFEDRVTAVLSGKADRGRDPILVTIHSFTAVYGGRRRHVELGVIHDSDSRLADAVLARAERDLTLVVRRNDPYGPGDGVTHTLKRHALPCGYLNVMFEIRNDLLADRAGQNEVAEGLAALLQNALGDLPPKDQVARKESDCPRDGWAKAGVPGAPWRLLDSLASCSDIDRRLMAGGDARPILVSDAKGILPKWKQEYA